MNSHPHNHTHTLGLGLSTHVFKDTEDSSSIKVYNLLGKQSSDHFVQQASSFEVSFMSVAQTVVFGSLIECNSRVPDTKLFDFER